MAETISEENLLKMHNDDYTAYAVSVARERAIPSAVDGLKPVHRKILYTMFHDFTLYPNKATKKTARVGGTVMGKYHPHGDMSIYDAIKHMVNWFEIYEPLIFGQGGFGSMYGDSASAPRYTEIKLSDFAMDCVISDLKYTDKAVDWIATYDNSDKEPKFLPAAVPLLLINGTFGIAVGIKTEVPKHNINEVLDATIKLIRHPNAEIVLVPDSCSGSDIIEADFDTISKTGRGTFKMRGRIEITEYNGSQALRILSMPDLKFFNSVKEQIEKLIQTNILSHHVSDILNATTLDEHNNELFEVYIILKKGADPNYVKEILYSSTSMQATVAVNFEVIKDDTPVVMNYKQYLLAFLQGRRETKFRLYTNKLQQAKTKYHELELYIKALESGEIDNIIEMIKRQTGTDDSVYVNYLVDKLNITPLQAKFLLGIDFKKLSLGYLNLYKQKRQEYFEDAQAYLHKISHIEELDDEIEDELKRFKKKYGCPRKSKIISIDEASNIPEGYFKIILTKNNFIKKIPQNEDKIGSLGGDEAAFVIPVENRDNLIIFGSMGKVFKYPVHKIQFAPKGSNGVDIRSLIKNLTSDICAAIPESMLKDIAAAEPKNYIYTITEGGLLKRMDIEDFLNVPPSGIIYSKMEQGDSIKDIIFMSDMCDLLIYAKNKVLRINGTEAPYVKRSTKGNNAMDTKYLIDGFACLYPSATDVVVVTENGKVNKVSVHGVPLSARARAGSTIIRLGKTDKIKKIMVCEATDTIAITSKNGVADIKVADIPEGSSISAGVKMADSGVINVKVI